MSVFNLATISLIVIAALGYSVATIGMKLGSTSLSTLALSFLVAGFFAAAYAEIIILKSIDLGFVYICILALETLIILSFAALIGEGLNLRQLSGAGLVLAGLVVVAH